MATETREKASTAAICKSAGIPPPAVEVAPGEHYKHLIAEGLLPEAVRFVANAMTPEAAVKWAFESVKKLQGGKVTDARKAALHATEQWLAKPDETNRRLAHEAAEADDLSSAEGCLALAVFFSGGSISPATAPDVPPPPNVCQRVAAGAVTLAVVGHEPAKAPERFQVALHAGSGHLG